MFDRPTTFKEILFAPVMLLAWVMIDVTWRLDGASRERERQKRAKQLGVTEHMRQAALVYEVNYPKNDNVSIDLENLLVAAEWLRENVGQQGVVWDLKVDTINHGDNVFIFKDEKYAAAFKLAFT